MTLQLHDYQKECIGVIADTFKNRKNQLVQLPTGSGKTWIFLNYLKDHSKKAIITCPSKELQNQILEWGRYFIGDKLSASPRTSRKDMFVVTAASLNYESTYRELDKLDADTIVIDEAHHVQSETYLRFLNRYSKTHKFNLLGCTATPERMDRKSLEEIFEEISYSKTIYEMINEGHLCDMKGWRVKTGCELENLMNHSGDFKHHSLKRLDIDSRNRLILNVYEQHCTKRKTLIFCIDIEHAIKISESLSKAGYKSAYIHGKLSLGERKKIIERFKSGELQVLTNCQLLTEGFDEPSIDAIIIARPTRSKTLYCQMLGRGLRKFPGKDYCHLFELTDNNHNICTFNTAADHEPEFIFNYEDGIKLSELKKKTEGMNIESLIIKTEEFKVFNNSLDSWLNGIPALEIQLKRLKRNLPGQPTALEAAFLLWKQNLREKYGYNN